METLGIFLAVLGGVLAISIAVALAFSRNEREDVSAWQWTDIFLLGGLVFFASGLIKGISDGFRNRSSSEFCLAIMFILSASITAIGVFIVAAS